MLLNRLVQAIPIMILATFLVFSLLQLVPGGSRKSGSCMA